MRLSNKIYLSILALGLVVLAGEVVWILNKKRQQPDMRTVQMPPLLAEVATTSPFRSLLDGTTVTSSEEVVPNVLGVMLDNHPDARPQAGLSQARVVYEAPVEGGLTRYFALFSTTDNVEKLGPVRSARPYFLDWLNEYGNSYYWHVGGSPAALAFLEDYGSRNADLYYLSSVYYWRSQDREAPHNVYTNTQKWQSYLSRTNQPMKNWQGWNFSDTLLASSTPVSNLQISFSSDYVVGWSYDNGRYTRTVNGRTLSDESKSPIKADTVVVQEAEVQVIDEDGRRDIDTLAGGKARVLRDGQMIRGTWKKNSYTGRTRFYDESGVEIPFHPGKIWIEVVPENTSVEVST